MKSNDMPRMSINRIEFLRAECLEQIRYARLHNLTAWVAAQQQRLWRLDRLLDIADRQRGPK